MNLNSRAILINNSLKREGDQLPFMKFQLAVVTEVLGRGIITDDDLSKLVLDPEVGGAYLRKCVEKGMANHASVSDVADEYLSAVESKVLVHSMLRQAARTDRPESGMEGIHHVETLFAKITQEEPYKALVIDKDKKRMGKFYAAKPPLTEVGFVAWDGATPENRDYDVFLDLDEVLSQGYMIRRVASEIESITKLASAKNLNQFSVHFFDFNKSVFIPYDLWTAGKLNVDDVCMSLSSLIQDASNKIDICCIKTLDTMSLGVTASLLPSNYNLIKHIVTSNLGSVSGQLFLSAGSGTVVDPSKCYILKEHEGLTQVFIPTALWNSQIEMIRSVKPTTPITVSEFLGGNSLVYGFYETVLSKDGTYIDGIVVKVEGPKIGTFSGLVRGVTVKGQRMSITVDPDFKQLDPASGPTSIDDIPEMSSKDVKKNMDKRLEDLSKAKTEEEKANAISRIKELARLLKFDVFRIEGQSLPGLIITSRIDPLLETTFEQSVNPEDFENPGNGYPQTTRNQRPKITETDLVEVLTQIVGEDKNDESK